MANTLIRITTVPMAFKVLLSGQPKYMHEHGFNVIMISADGKELEDVKATERCVHIIVPMTRKITPLQDIICFLKLRKIFKKYKPDIVHTHTPKAGLLGMMAARSAGVKIRIHTVAGLPLMLATGFKKRLLLLTERQTYAAATNIWPNSKSMWDYIVKTKLVKPIKLGFISKGSTNGVNLEKFSKLSLNTEKKNKIRSLLPETDAIKLLCVGRMVKDKGITELVNVFKKLQEHYQLQLILVGPFEPHLDPLPGYTMDIINNDPGIIHINWSDDVEYFMDVADIFVHPSYREGFPNVIMQAGAMQIPVVCSNISGNIDIIQHEKNGLVFEVKNETDLFEKIRFAITDPGRMKDYSAALYDKISVWYDRKKIHYSILETYNSLLEQNGLPPNNI